ncbi:rho guanine nucleotide exchange factor 17-like isoform X3 [Acanthaster planci]|uniref:Rho guanine nucleotide exchange factor 17-like isoform X3 n=1 Tax=Acanthaster planci TaxID=133434 RepID=A0A8B7Z1R2_ACAPL|nr:rho guanine nucleotide exchange factor 17-like isoform X3 [Acanthaster planci]
MAHSSTAAARGKKGAGLRAGAGDSVQLQIANRAQTSDSDRERSLGSSKHRQFNHKESGNTRTGSCRSTVTAEEHRVRGHHHLGTSSSHATVSVDQDRRSAIELYGAAAEPSLALSNKQPNVQLEHGKDKEHAWNIIGGNSRQTQAAGGGSKCSNRILAGDSSRQQNKDTSYRQGVSSPPTTTQTGQFGTATSTSAGRDPKGYSSSESRTVYQGQSPASIQEKRAVARRVGAFIPHEQSPSDRGYSQGNVHSKVNTAPPVTSPKSPDSVTSLSHTESGITSPGQTRQVFKPLAVKRLTKTTKKNLASFDELQSPVSSPYSSRRSSVSSVGTVDQSEGSVAENRARLVSAFVLSTQNNTATSRYRDWSGTHTPSQTIPLKVDNVRRTMARNQDSPTSASDPSSPQLSESGGTKLTLRMDFNSLKIGSVENLKSQSRSVTSKKVIPDKNIASMSAPTSPVRTLQKLTSKMRGRRQEYTDIPHGEFTRPMSPASEPGEDEGCVRDFEWPPASQTLPRPRRKNRMVIPELPEVLLARSKEVSGGTQASTSSPMDKFNLKAPLRPLNVKKQSETTPASSSPVMDTMAEEATDEFLSSSVRKKERRKKFGALGQSVTEGSGGNNGENGRSRSDPTQDRKRGSFSEEIEKTSVDSQFFEALQIQGVHGHIPTASSLGTTVVSTESSQSISSTATSISDATAEQQYMHVLQEVTHHPDGLINSSNLDSQERNGKLKSKVKSRTWPNGDKAPNELDQYTQGIQVSTSNPTVSDRQEEIDRLHRGEEPDDLRAKSENLLTPGGKERVNLQLALDSPHSPQMPRNRNWGSRSGYEELPEPQENTSEVLQHQGCSSKQSLIQADKHVRSASEPATTLSPADDTAVPSLRKPVVTITRSQSMGPNQHHPQERKFPLRKKAIIPPPQPGHSLRPVMQAHMSESTPNLASEPHASRVTDALVSPTISKSNRILASQIGSSTLPRSNKDKSVELSPATRRKRKQQDIKLHIMQTLLETEQSYVYSLETLVKSYMRPLKSPEYAHLCADPGMVDAMFYKLPEILNCHENFLQQLQMRINHWHDNQKIGDIISASMAKQPVLDTYTAFTNNFNRAKELISKASSKPAFFKFLEDRTKEHKERLNLDDLIIQPIQRIPRYELLLKELIDNTPEDHPDQESLQQALNTVKTLATAIDESKNKADIKVRDEQALRDLEAMIDGHVELVSPQRRFIRQYGVTEMQKGARKDRCVFLFSDLILCATVKRRSGGIRRPSISALSPVTLPMEACKYKLAWKLAVDDVEIVKSPASTQQANQERDLSKLEEDLSILGRISGLTETLSSPHQSLDEVLKELTETVSKRLAEMQALPALPTAVLSKLELTATTHEGIESFVLLFQGQEARQTFENDFAEAKKKLAARSKDHFPPVFLYPIPIMKTRSGMQFSCAAPSLGTMSNSLRDVWVCNSDGYVGQVCLLSLTPEPTVAFCISVCSARILCIAPVPGAQDTHSMRSRVHLRVPKVPLDTGQSRPLQFLGEATIANNGRCLMPASSHAVNQQASDIMPFDSDDSEEEEEMVMSPGSGLAPEIRLQVDDVPMEEASSEEDLERISSGNNLEEISAREDLEVLQPTMWLGTEDGCIHIYQCTDNIRTRKSRTKVRHPAAVQCILYLDNKVFVSLANGDLTVYRREPGHAWDTKNPLTVTLGSSTTPISKMVSVCSKLWCGCQNNILVVDPNTLNVEHQFSVSNDTQKTVHCIVSSGLGVWVTLQATAVVRLYHASTYENLCDVDVTQTVYKMLAGSDAIIRQHKAACLRITALLICKELLWVGTSAGVVLTLPHPKITTTTTSLARDISFPNGSGQGHTGHVRFLTAVDIPSGKPAPVQRKISEQVLERSRELHPPEMEQQQRRASSAAAIVSNMMVISGGDGYEDFSATTPNEAAGKEDSTNHLLLWQV